jgi:hypothetical protein
MTTAPPKDIVDRAKPKPRVEMALCDSCRAQAYYFATINETVLSYCAHHGTKYEVGLLAKATKIVDLRYLVDP